MNHKLKADARRRLPESYLRERLKESQKLKDKTQYRVYKGVLKSLYGS